MKVLFIKSNPKNDEDSYSCRLANAFLESYQELNPESNITRLDLYRVGLESFTQESLEDLYGNPESLRLKPALQFATSDRYIFADPMWNLSIPSVLKSYIEYISVPGVTFTNTTRGPIGLLSGKGKKAIHITARGGIYSTGPGKDIEMGDRYLRLVLGFLGIETIETLAIEGTSSDSELEKRFNEAVKAARIMAQEF